MGDVFLTDEAALREMIDRWLLSYEVIGTKLGQWGDAMFESLDTGGDTTFDYQLQTVSAKEWMLPQTETLLTYQSAGWTQVHECFDSTPRILFGIRPCDQSGMLSLDDQMRAPPADAQYMLRRRNTLSIVISCPRIFSGHFCHLTGTGPWMRTGFDWQLTQVEQGWIVQVGSPGGHALLQGVSDLLRQVGPDCWQALLRQRRQASDLIGESHDFRNLSHRLAHAEGRREIWHRLSSRCLQCGGCSFVCPSCGCFSISDVRADASSGQRVRGWDSCALSGFTQMAGGHNPSDVRSSRLRRRMFHKLSCRSHTGRPMCVGCARCLTACLGDISLPDALREITL